MRIRPPPRRFELGLKREQQFHKTFNEVRQAAPGWTPDGWKGVDEMHGQRNSVQHQGVLPDGKEFSRWSADAQRFIHSLIAAVFQIQLQDVAVADAVATETIREKLREAELAIDAGDFQSAFDGVWNAFELARERWSSQHRDAVPRRASRPATTMDLAPADVREQVEIFGDYHDVAVFAPDMGDYVWLRSARSAARENLPLTEEEARRAFVFVLGWVLRWEAFSSRYSLSVVRMLTHVAGQKPPTTGAHTPNVIAADLEPGFREALTVRLQLADVPESYGGAWLQHFGEALRHELGSSEASAGADVDGSGLISIYDVPPTDESKLGLTACVKKALAATEAPYRESVREWEEWRAIEPELTQPYIDALRPLRFEGHDLCGQPQLDKGGAVGSLLLRPVTRAAGRGDLQHAFWKEFYDRGVGDINGPLELGQEGILRFRTAEFDADALAAILAEVASAIELDRASGAASKAAEAERFDSMKSLLEAQFPSPGRA